MKSGKVCHEQILKLTILNRLVDSARDRMSNPIKKEREKKYFKHGWLMDMIGVIEL